MKKVFYAVIILLGITTSYAQSIEVNTNKDGKILILTANKRGTTYRVDDSIVKSGVVFFSVGYQSSLLSGVLTEAYFIELDIVHNDNRLGCLQEYKSKVVLILEDDTQIECFQMSESDCGQQAFKAAFALMPQEGQVSDMKTNFEKLQATEIKELIVYTTAREMDFKISSKKRDFVKNHFNLISSTLKNDK